MEDRRLQTPTAARVRKDLCMLAFERRRIAEEHNLRPVFHIKDIPCDTQMRTRLDVVDPHWLRPAYRALFRKAQRGKALEKMVFMEGCYLIALDGTGYFSSQKLFSPYCLVKSCSKSGKTIYQLQALGAAMVHPDSRTVIPLAPEPICKRDGQTKNDCERNAAKRWFGNFREDHPHLKAIIIEDALSPNAPHIRDILAADCHFILGVKQDDHKYLFSCVDAAVQSGKAVEHDLVDEKDPRVHHFFRFTNGVPLNESNKDLLVNLLEYCEEGGQEAPALLLGNRLHHHKGQRLRHHEGRPCPMEDRERDVQHPQKPGLPPRAQLRSRREVPEPDLLSLMMLAFLVDQLQELCCALYREVRKKKGSKRELFETIRGAFGLIVVHSMEMLYRLILAGPQRYQLIPIEDSS